MGVDKDLGEVVGAMLAYKSGRSDAEYPAKVIVDVLDRIRVVELKARRWDALVLAAGMGGSVMVFQNVDNDSYPVVTPKEMEALADELREENK